MLAKGPKKVITLLLKAKYIRKKTHRWEDERSSKVTKAQQVTFDALEI